MATSDSQALLLQVSADISGLERQLRRAGVLVDDFGKKAHHVEGLFGNLGEALHRVFDSSRLRVLEEGGARISVFGSALEALGPAGIAAGAGIAAVALAFEQARSAAEFAQNIQDTANRLHITTDALQEYRFAIEEAGGHTEQADEALGQFSVTLGNAQGGLRRATQAFASVGFTRAQVTGFRDTETALHAVIERISELSTTAQRDAALHRFGLDGLAPVINQGVDALDRFREEAHSIGAVMDSSLIHRGAEANHQFEALQHVVGVQLHSAFVDLAPVITGLLSLVVSFASVIAEIVDNIRSLENRTAGGLETRRAQLADQIFTDQQTLATQGNQAHGLGSSEQDLASGIIGAASGGNGIQAASTVDAQGIQTRLAENQAELQRINGILAARAAADRPTPPTGDRNLIPPPGAAHHAPEDHSQQAIDQAQEALLAAQRAELEAQLANTHDVEERGRIQDQIIEVERTQQRAAIQKRIDALNSDRHITAAARAEAIASLQAANLVDDHVAALKTQAQDDQTALEASAHDLAILTQSHGYSVDILNSQSAMATTMRERREIETRILRIRQQEERDALEQQIAEQHLNPTEAGRLRQGLSDRQGSEINTLNFNTRGPLEQLSASIPSTAAEMNEALQNVATHGVQSLTDGLVDAITHVKTLGDVFKQVALQIVADLLRIQIERSIERPLLNLLGSFLGTPAATALGGIQVGVGDTPISIGHNASGTSNWRGGLTQINERGGEIVDLPSGSRIYPAGLSRAIAGAQAGGGGSTVVQHIDLRGSYIAEREFAKVRAYADQTAARAAGGALRVAQKALPGQMRSRQLLQE